MGAVTYPDNRVAAYMNDHFANLKIDMTAKHPDFKDASAPGKVIFAPKFIFRDAKGREIRRYLGWLPADHFLAELRFVVAMNHFNRGEFLPARELFEKSVAEFPEADVAPETLYWSGIAGFLGGKFDMDTLKSSWNSVRERYPHSTWARRAEPIEDVV